MYEVEVKVEAAHGPVRARLGDLHAEYRDVVSQRDVYYDHPGRSFAETDEALRLRRESPSEGDETVATVTYKGPIVDDLSKSRPEAETVVGDPRAADEILRSVGFVPAAEVEKVRERFAIEGFSVVLDRIHDLGEFVEIEARTDAEAEVEALRDDAFALCRRIGLDPTESIRTSYLSLLLEEGTTTDDDGLHSER